MLLTITGLGKTVLLLVAGTFIAWAIVTAIFIPRRDTRFPRDLNLYITLTVVLFVLQMGAVWWVTGTQDEEAEAAEVAETTEGGTTEGETTAPTQTETAGGETTGATETETGQTETTETGTTVTETTEPTETSGGAGGNAEAGKAVFASAGCGGCHTLADAGSNGAVGPNLDESSPSEDKVVERVTNGKGVMPSFKGQLSEQQIADVAAYVSTVTDS